MHSPVQRKKPQNGARGAQRKKAAKRRTGCVAGRGEEACHYHGPPQAIFSL